jgi:hypothetical protein
MKTPEVKALVVGFIVDGNTEKDIAEYLAATHPDAGDPAAVIAEAMADIRASCTSMSGKWRSWALYALRELYRRSVEIGEVKAAAGILKDIDKMARS